MNKPHLHSIFIGALTLSLLALTSCAKAPSPSYTRSSATPDRSPASVPPQEAAPAPRPGHSHAAAPVPALTGDAAIDQAFDNLRKGNLAYTTPKTMKTGQTVRVVARIGSDLVSLSILQSGLPQGNQTQSATAATPVSTKMKMTLTSADFDITPLSSQEQYVGGTSPTEWEWDISPKHSGNLQLHLAAIVELQNLSRDYTSIDRDINVTVDPINAATNFAEQNTVWILGGAGTGLLALWGWFKRRKQPASSGVAAP